MRAVGKNNTSSCDSSRQMRSLSTPSEHINNQMHVHISPTIHRGNQHQRNRFKCYKWLLQACMLWFVWFLSWEIIKMNAYLLLNNSL